MTQSTLFDSLDTCDETGLPLPAVSVARRFNVPGFTFEDLCQEAALAVWKAARKVIAGREREFPGLAKKAAYNRLVDLYRRSRRQVPLDGSVRANPSCYDPEKVRIEDVFAVMPKSQAAFERHLESLPFVVSKVGRSSWMIAMDGEELGRVVYKSGRKTGFCEA